MADVTVLCPEYFPRFRCKCGDCRTVCCQGWRISMTEAEYRRMLALPASPELRGRLGEAFTVAENASADRYAFISPDESGFCRLLDGDGFCMVHRECGEGVQPSVCRLYPRAIRPGEITEAVCSGSCEKTVEMLMTEEPMAFVRLSVQTKAPLPEDCRREEQKEEIRRRCLELWQREGEDALTRIREIGAEVNSGWIPDTEKSLYSAALQLLRELGPISVSLKEILPRVLSHFAAEKSGAALSPESLCRIREAEAAADRRLPAWRRYIDNVMANHMFYCTFPYAGAVHTRHSLCGLGGTYGALLLLCAWGLETAEGDPAVVFADMASLALRFIEHTDFYRNAAVVLGKK